MSLVCAQVKDFLFLLLLFFNSVHLTTVYSCTFRERVGG